MSTIRNERSFLDQIRFSRGLRLWQVMARGLGVVAVVAIFGLLGKLAGTGSAFLPADLEAFAAEIEAETGVEAVIVSYGGIRNASPFVKRRC